MDVALYAPGVGYYARPRSPFGPGGDYYTAGRLPLFARTVAARVDAVRAAMGRPEPFHLVDLGSGDGLLAAGIVRALGVRDAAGGVEVVVIDRAPWLTSSALDAVTPVAREAGATVRSASSLAEVGPVQGFVLAHELLDAVPARRLVRRDGDWCEAGFRLDAGRLVPAERRPGTPILPPPSPVPGEEEDGMIFEVAPGATALLREVADHLTEGLFAVVDYGDEEIALRAAHPRGTLAALRAHRPVDVPIQAPGEADLSVFVNFTRLRSAARAAGLVEIAYRSQAEALTAWGMEGELARLVEEDRSAESEVRARLAAKNLLFGFGTFRILELAAPASAARLRALSVVSPAAPS